MPIQCFCCSGSTIDIFIDNNLSISKCSLCGTIEVKYFASIYSSIDYYENNYFLNDRAVRSLLRTRFRQSKLIYFKLMKEASKGLLLIDYGSGYGTFLKYLKSIGHVTVEAIENSPIAVSRLKSFTTAHLIRNSIELLNLLKTKKEIDFVSALDVLEHFQSDDLKLLIEILSNSSVNIKRLIIKVPSSNGILFTIALWLARLNISKSILYKLLQLASPPPHYIYFSKDGLKALLEKHGFLVRKTLYDSDYEIIDFGCRIVSSRLLSHFITLSAVPILSFTILFFPRLRDSMIIRADNISKAQKY